MAIGQRPFPLFVEFADHARAHVLAPVVELFLQLILDHLAFFLDHQNFFQPLGKAAHPLWFERPDHADLVEPDTDLGRKGIVNAKIIEGLAHIEVGFAGGDDAESCRFAASGRVNHDLVQPIGAAIGLRGIELVIQQAGLLQQAIIRPADIEAVRGQGEIRGHNDLDAIQRDVHRGRGFDRVRHCLEADPATGIAAHGPAVQAEVQVFLHAGRHQYRHHRGLQRVFRLVGNGGRARRVIVAGDCQHAAVLPGASGIGMLEHVAAAIDPRPLAVPHAKHAVMLGAGREIDLLRTPNRGCGEIFIDAGLKHDLVLHQMGFGFPQRLIQPAQR